MKQSNGQNLLNFWGKARSETPGLDWHPLAYHSLDVAATGACLLEGNQILRLRLSKLMKLEEKEAQKLCVFLLSLHDIGKFSKVFQHMACPNLYEVNFGPRCDKIQRTPHHSTAGWQIWDLLLREELYGGQEALDLCGQEALDRQEGLDLLGRAVFGHHGVPPENKGLSRDRDGLKETYGKNGINAAISFSKKVLDIFSPGVLPTFEEKVAEKSSFLLAGVAVMADWIGSNQEWFPYQEPKKELEEYYWHVAYPSAKKAVRESGVLPSKTALKPRNFRNLMLSVDREIQARPMQDWAEKVVLPQGPGLFLIEDVTGSGKTEAALMLAHRIVTAQRAGGLYIALPTQATANAMFERMKGIYKRFFAEDSKPSIILVHSKREMNPEFRELKMKGLPDNNYGDDTSNESATAQCERWITDDQRKSFFADIGAGTIDQALLSVLATRHQSLRLVGLVQRVLILDEVHAYDAYVQQEIMGLLKFQAALGGDAILLSATLPREVRSHFINSWHEGLGLQLPQSNLAGKNEEAYPLATKISGQGTNSSPVPVSPESIRKVRIRMLENHTDELEGHKAALEEIRKETACGKSVVYIRNAVDDAIDAYNALEDLGEKRLLFHARFTAYDRYKIEHEVMRIFGKDSTPDDRRGRVLIATQVVEQSLDLDFDFMVSDLAPIDLVIQRAGRLWRHKRRRTSGSGLPELLIVSPCPVDNPAKDWASQISRRTRWVYEDHAKLWLTARLLKDMGEIETPEKSRTLIEKVYGRNVEKDVPESLSSSLIKLQGQEMANRMTAQNYLLSLNNGYCKGSEWEDEANALTRLSEPMTKIRLMREVNGEIKPWADPPNSQGSEDMNFRLSELMVRRVYVSSKTSLEHSYLSALEEVMSGWKRWERETIVPIVLEESEDDSWIGKARSDKKGEVTISYSSSVGLSFPQK